MKPPDALLNVTPQDQTTSPFGLAMACQRRYLLLPQLSTIVDDSTVFYWLLASITQSLRRRVPSPIAPRGR
jgi:hypothetical protein